MANKITDFDKAKRRGMAAKAEGKPALAKIFFNKAKELKVSSK
jgi:hypothetical protein